MRAVPEHKPPEPESGVSEIIGAIMLISLVVMAVGIIAMVLFSQTTPARIPNVNFMVGSNYPPTTLYLYHNGGDSLRTGEFEVVLDGTSRPYALEGGGDSWTIGRRLNIDISTMASLPREVTLVYNSTGGGATAIHSAPVNFSSGPVIVGPDVFITPTPAPTTAPVPPQLAKEIYYREGGTAIVKPAVNTDPGNYFALEVTSAGNSWINASSRTATGTRITYPLSSGNRVKVTFRTGTTDFTAFGLNTMMWNMSATAVNVSIYYPLNATWVELFSNNNRNLFDAWIAGCRDYGSTLRIQNTSTARVHTTLIINNTRILQGFDSNNVVISRIHPVNPGIFVLKETTSTGRVTLLGFADSTTANGIECNSTACLGIP